MPTTDTTLYPMTPGATVLVTGGTGFTGRHLLPRLVEHGMCVRATARETSSREGLEELPIDWRVGLLHDEAFIRSCVEGAEYIFHLASNYRQSHGSEEDHRNIHVVSTQHLAGAASEQAAFKRFVHVSTVGVHGHIDEPPADETYPFSPGDIYQRSKLEGEQWLLAYARESGLPAVVVRPAAIYGPGDRRLFKVFKMATSPIVPLVGFGRCLYHLIYVDDLVAFMLLVAEHPSAVGEAFICAASEPMTIEDFVRVVGKHLGVRNRFVRIPAAPLMGAAIVCDRVCQVLKVDPPLYPRRVAFFTKDRSFDTTKMQQRLDFKPRCGNAEGIRATADWYIEQGWLPPRKEETA